VVLSAARMRDHLIVAVVPSLERQQVLAELKGSGPGPQPTKLRLTSAAIRHTTWSMGQN